LAELTTFDLASLEQFTSDLVAAGFEPVGSTDRRCWEGPISLSLATLTTATTMRICIREGWPFRHPHLVVRGLEIEHVNDQGVVCLWQEDDNSREWISYEGLTRRIADWCHRAQTGFGPEDQALDAFMGWTTRTAVLATYDLDTIRPRTAHGGQTGRFHGSQLRDSLIQLRTGAGAAESLGGHWFHVGDLSKPPRNMAELRSMLTGAQTRTLNKCVNRLASSPRSELALIIGRRHGSEDVLVLRLSDDGNGGMKSEALEPAPNDHATLVTRAGPSAWQLGNKKVVCFGVGAIGSHVALLLSESGIGSLRLVDEELLRPGNVVRHAVGQSGVSLSKVDAVKSIIAEHAPWTMVEVTPTAVWNTDDLTALLRGIDVAIDGTGNAAFGEEISRLADQCGVPLVSVALYRQGAIGRVRRQHIPTDTRIFQRASDQDYPVIPEGSDNLDDQIPMLEQGCSAPVNNAPPSSVVAVSALCSQMTIDALTGRMLYPDEVIDVYEPLEESPFDQIGRVGHH
jgi:molybdopterin/thiamine biosynthesis adenylyltransferase